MRFRLDYVPSTFDEAIAEVLAGLTAEERQELVKLNGSELYSLHLSLGVRIRDAWSLFDPNTPLRRDCQKRGLPNTADDVAMAILQEAWAELCGG